MTREQLVDVKNVVAKAENLLLDISETELKLNRITDLRNTKGGVDDIISKDFVYIFNVILGKDDDYRESLTEDKEKFLDACIEVLSARLEKLKVMFAELPTYHSKADCLKEMVNNDLITD